MVKKVSKLELALRKDGLYHELDLTAEAGYLKARGGLECGLFIHPGRSGVRAVGNDCSELNAGLSWGSAVRSHRW